MNILNWFRKVFRNEPQVRSAARVWVGDGTWPFVAVEDGQDIILRPRTPACKMHVTWFGGDDDPQDSGETASGVMTKGNPNVMGCALPMPAAKSCRGTPLKQLPYLQTLVTLSVGRTHLTVPLIDIGPARSSGNTLDLTQRAFKQFAPLRRGKFRADEIRIIDALKHFSPQ